MAEDKKKASDKAKDSQTDNKHKALEAALAQIEKNYGKGAVMRLGENVGMNSMVFCLLFMFTGINKILTYFICKSNSQIGKNTAVQTQFFVTLLMYKNIYIEKYQSLSA